MERPLLTVRQAAAYLNVVPHTIYRYVRQQKIPFLRLHGYSLRFRQEDLDAWLEQRGQRGAP
jgi:excisionase family DNA binding protein